MASRINQGAAKHQYVVKAWSNRTEQIKNRIGGRAREQVVLSQIPLGAL
jgi:hypothetical protein